MDQTMCLYVELGERSVDLADTTTSSSVDTKKSNRDTKVLKVKGLSPTTVRDWIDVIYTGEGIQI